MADNITYQLQASPRHLRSFMDFAACSWSRGQIVIQGYQLSAEDDQSVTLSFSFAAAVDDKVRAAMFAAISEFYRGAKITPTSSPHPL